MIDDKKLFQTFSTAVADLPTVYAYASDTALYMCAYICSVYARIASLLMNGLAFQ